MFAIILVILLIYFHVFVKDMVYVKSDIDERMYLVRNVEDKQYASNMLAKIRQNILNLSDYLYQHADDKEFNEYKQYIIRLHEKAPHIILTESSGDSDYTSYSINKGEQIIFCLRHKGQDKILHDINLIMYVVLHEISHVACPIYDNHGPLFRKIFSFITRNGISIGVYERIDFHNNPEKYCGMIIDESIV